MAKPRCCWHSSERHSRFRCFSVSNFAGVARGCRRRHQGGEPAGLGWTPPGPLGPAPPPDLLITRAKNIFDLKTPGVLVIFSVFRFVAALVCREQILFLNSSRNQEQPRPGTAGGALVSKLPSLAALCVGHRRCRVWGRSGNLVLDQSTTGF